MNAHERTQLWDKLVTGEPLNQRGSATIEERMDLRGICVPDPAPIRKTRIATATAKELSSVVIVRNAHWKGIDLSGCRLNAVRFFDCVIEDCSFEVGAARVGVSGAPRF